MDKPSIPETAPMQSAAKPPKEISLEWRRWVAENVLLNKEPNSIIAAMVREGIDPAKAAMELRTALTLGSSALAFGINGPHRRGIHVMARSRRPRRVGVKSENFM